MNPAKDCLRRTRRRNLSSIDGYPGLLAFPILQLSTLHSHCPFPGNSGSSDNLSVFGWIQSMTEMFVIFLDTYMEASKLLLKLPPYFPHSWLVQFFVLMKIINQELIILLSRCIRQFLDHAARPAGGVG